MTMSEVPLRRVTEYQAHASNAVRAPHSRGGTVGVSMVS